MPSYAHQRFYFFTKVRIIFRRYNFSLKDGDEDAEDEDAEDEEFEDEDAEEENAQDDEDEEQDEYPEDEVAEADKESDPLTGKSGFAHPIAS